jgi:hypothetical protein
MLYVLYTEEMDSIKVAIVPILPLLCRYFEEVRRWWGMRWSSDWHRDLGSK